MSMIFLVFPRMLNFDDHPSSMKLFHSASLGPSLIDENDLAYVEKNVAKYGES